MKPLLVFLLLFCLTAFVTPMLAQKGTFVEIHQLQGPQDPRLGLIIQGGSPGVAKGSLTPEREKATRAKLEEAVLAGYKALQAGKTSVESVEIAIRILEDSPLFNAGKGAAFTTDGHNELDASIMDGKSLAAGGVLGVRRVKNPIALANAIMERSKSTLMAGDGAEKFAKDQGTEMVDEKYFWTQEKWDDLQKALRDDKVGAATPLPPIAQLGGVGAVALDKSGNLAAGSSSGGVTNTKYGSVDESSIIGAATYANNDSCGISGFGTSGYFIDLGVARAVASNMEYRASSIQNAADLVIKQKLAKAGGRGGVVAMDKFGNMAISFNTEGMYRAYINSDGKPVIEIY